MSCRGSGRHYSLGMYHWTLPIAEMSVGCVGKKVVSIYPLQAGAVQLLLHFTSLQALQ